MDMNFNIEEAKKNASENSYGALPSGNYEVVVKNVEERETKTGRKSIQLDLVVRNDLDNVPALSNTNAKYHNRHVFMNLWTAKEDNATYSQKQVQNLLFQAGFNQPRFNFPLDFINFMKGKPLNAYVKKEQDEYNGQTREQNRVTPFSVTTTKFPSVQHQWADMQASPLQTSQQSFNGQPQADPFKGNGQPINISDDDLPF